MTTTNTRHLAAIGGIKHHHTRSEFSPGDGRRFAARLRHRAVRRSAAAVIANEIDEAREAMIDEQREAAMREAVVRVTLAEAAEYAAIAAEYAALAADLAEYAAFVDSNDVDQYAADVAEFAKKIN